MYVRIYIHVCIRAFTPIYIYIYIYICVCVVKALKLEEAFV